MLEDENECYRREIITKFESSQASRIDEMRKRVGLLREQREVHQKKFVEHKLDQAFQYAPSFFKHCLLIALLSAVRCDIDL